MSSLQKVKEKNKHFSLAKKCYIKKCKTGNFNLNLLSFSLKNFFYVVFANFADRSFYREKNAVFVR